MFFPQIPVAVSSLSFSQNKALVDRLLNHFPAARFTQNTLGSPEEIAKFYHGAHAILVGKEVITSSVISQNPQIEVLSKYGVGLDNLDQTLLRERKIALLHTPGVNRNCVAELTLGMILNLAHKISELSRLLISGTWLRSPGFDLHQKTVGILGCGNVGSRLGELLMPFGVETLVVDIEDRKDVCKTIGAAQVELQEMLERAQIISIHVPLTELTENMVDSEFLTKMRRNSLLINTSRGRVLCLNSLYRFLKSGHLAGAAMDVYPVEPPGYLKIWDLPNVLPTPHIGGASEDARLSMGNAAIENLVRFYGEKENSRCLSE